MTAKRKIRRVKKNYVLKTQRGTMTKKKENSKLGKPRERQPKKGGKSDHHEKCQKRKEKGSKKERKRKISTKGCNPEIVQKNKQKGTKGK